MVVTDSLFGDVECKQCALLRECLDIEREKRDYYEKLLLIKSGILVSTPEDVRPEEFESVRKIVTLSRLKHELEASSKKAALAKEEEKTEAEIIFERSLKDGIQENQVS